MSKPSWYAALALVVILTLLSGVMEGTLRRRWGASLAEKVAATKLQQLPKTIGDWETINEGELDATSLKMLQPSAYHLRTMKSPESTASVSMTLLLGPPGHIGAHTPEVCVSGVGYKQLGPAEKVTISDPGDSGLEATFWVATFRSNGFDRHILREYWAWSTGGPWEAATGSRMGYGFFPYLYKVQVGCRLPAGSNPDAFDPTTDLLDALVSEMPHYLLTAEDAEQLTENK